MKINNLKNIYSGLFVLLITVSILSNGNLIKSESIDLNGISFFASANAEDPDYSSGYVNNDEDCTVTTSHYCSISVCYITWCCTVGFWYTLDEDGTKNYCTYTGNPDSGCSYHECQANG